MLYNNINHNKQYLDYYVNTQNKYFYGKNYMFGIISGASGSSNKQGLFVQISKNVSREGLQVCPVSYSHLFCFLRSVQPKVAR